MFKPGDLIKHRSMEWYCIYGEPQSCTVLDEALVLPFSEGESLSIESRYWELAYREPKDSNLDLTYAIRYIYANTPDALYVPGSLTACGVYDPSVGAEKQQSNSQVVVKSQCEEVDNKDCDCTIISLLQGGCKCGGK